MRHVSSRLLLLARLSLLVWVLLGCRVFAQQATPGGVTSLTGPDPVPATFSLSSSPSGAVCEGAQVTITATVNRNSAGCGNFSWAPDGQPTLISQATTSTGSTCTYQWNTAGSYTVYVTADCDTDPLTKSITVTVQPASSGPITCDATATHVTNDGATICQGATLQLTPPTGSSNWVWSGTPLPYYGNWSVQMSASTGSIKVKPRKTATYTVAYNMPNVPCRLSKSFTVTLAPELSAEDFVDLKIINNECFNCSSLTPTVQNPDPAYTLTWYDNANANNPIGTGTSHAFTVTQNTVGWLGIAACNEYVGLVPLTVHQVQIRVNGQVPTTSVTLPTTITPPSLMLTAEVSQSLSTPTFQWYLDGQPVSGEPSQPQMLRATLPGEYTVTVTNAPTTTPVPGTGDPYTAKPVQVLGPLDGQTLNDQPLTYLSDITVLKANTMTPEQVASLAVADRVQTVTYANGFGQPLQQLAVQAGPGQEDLIKHFDYAGAATTLQSFLPFPLASNLKAPGRFDTEAAGDLDDYYQNKGGKPYATTTLEASPLGRPLSQTQSGVAWAGHAATISYGRNAANEVRYWQDRGGTGTFSGSEWYEAGMLSKQVQLDPDNRTTEIFTDVQGRVVLQRKRGDSPGSSTTIFDTYNVYDEAGQLRLTIPPAAVEEMKGNNNWDLASQTSDFAARWLYQYTYDARGRLIERQFPGAEPVYLVYDAADRAILVQDGLHRKRSEWLFTKFDAQNRSVVAGSYQDGNGRQDVQDAADSFPALPGYESRTNNQDGYTLTQTFPDNNLTLLTETFYEDYDLNGNQQPDASYQAVSFGSTVTPAATTQLRGLVTATRRRVVQPDQQYGDWLTTFFFYDQYGNVLQKRGDNQLNLGGFDDKSTLLYREQGFTPQVLQAEKTQQTSLTGLVMLRNRFQYDVGGRPLQNWQQVFRWGDWQPEVLLSSNHYTGLGELTQKQLHSRDGLRFLQTEDFAYNQHGQLTRINQSNLTVNPENDLFGLELGRETPLNGLTNTVRYDGGVSAVTWGTHNPDQKNQPERERSYTFGYDGLGRLLEARYVARDLGSGAQWTQEEGAYDEREIQYDANGNITQLQRYTQVKDGAPAELMDDLVFHYEMPGGERSNQLQQVDDQSGDARGFRGSASNTYKYDENGSQVDDGNKGVRYRYNVLNKVEAQEKYSTPGSSTVGKISYTYDAAGTVLQRDISTPAGDKSYYYIDGLVYEISAGFSGLRSIPTPEGRALVENAQTARLTYEYHLRDHLGNLRVAFRAQAGTEHLRLSSEALSEEGDYPKFKRVSSTWSTAVGGYHGSQAAAVTDIQSGPAISIPVSNQDHIKLRVYYKTPAGVQYPTTIVTSPPQTARPTAPLLWSVTPVMLPSAPTREGEQPNRATPGVQLSLTGLLSRLTKPKALRQVPDEAPTTNIGPNGEAEAYIRWTLTDADGNVVNTGRCVAQVTTASPSSVSNWTRLDLPYDVNLGNARGGTGKLLIEEINEGRQPVYFDSLTITHPLDRALVSQEQHYYPFGMAMSGVAVNTVPAAEISKQQFNDGSDLEDELLGTEGGVYSTPFRTYDPSTGRFTGVDPLADVTPDLSPYHFSNNDPVNFNDPSGAQANGLGHMYGPFEQNPRDPNPYAALFYSFVNGSGFWDGGGVGGGGFFGGGGGGVGGGGGGGGGVGGGVGGGGFFGGGNQGKPQPGKSLQQMRAEHQAAIAKYPREYYGRNTAERVFNPKLWFHLFTGQGAFQRDPTVAIAELPPLVDGPVAVDAQVVGESITAIRNIPWSSSSVRAAASKLLRGATSVVVRTRAEAEELFLRLYQSTGVRNSTGMSATEAKAFFEGKAGTYHWDDIVDEVGQLFNHGPNNAHGNMKHVQVHTQDGDVIRIYFE